MSSASIAAARSKATAPARLAELALDPSCLLLSPPANPNTPLATLEQLAHDLDVDVRAALAKNTQLPAEERALAALL